MRDSEEIIADPVSLEELISRYEEVIHFAALSFTGEEDASEIVSEKVMEKLIQDWKQGTRCPDPEMYLSRLVREESLRLMILHIIEGSQESGRRFGA